ncbi:MAG: TerD family protein [Gammaproteobacteria bacterium]|nr:TerD family protein [Gammaproteobacteria bacterium]
MSTALVQGGNLSLGKVDRHLASVFVGLSWEVPQGNPPLEIDASLFLLTAARVVRNDDDFIFYNQESDVAGAVYRVPSDELDEASDRDGFVIRLNELDEEIQRVAFCLSLYEGNGRGKDFSAASVLRARLVNQDTEMELAHYQSENDVSCETALILAELYRYREEWKFRAVGQGFKGGLNALATHFGVLVSGGDNQLQAQAHSGSVGNAPLQTARLPVSLEKDVPATDGKPRRRRTLHDILNAQVEDIKRRYRLLQPLLRRAAQGSPNESQSRLLLDRILQDVLGYELDEIKTEQKIQGRSADYVLAPTGQDTKASCVVTCWINSGGRDRRLVRKAYSPPFSMRKS